MKKYKLGIIGTGSLGGIIANSIKDELKDNYTLLGLLGRDMEKTVELSKNTNSKAYKNLEEMIGDRPDYIIEAASPDTVKDLGPRILKEGISLIILSAGALANEGLYKEMGELALANGARVHVPSGAVGGFDVLQAARLMEDGRTRIITEKAPKSLNGAPFLEGRKLSEESQELVFKGTAREAIKYFPKNINVAVATALATNGVEDTEVIIRSIPGLKSNKHRIEFLAQTVRVGVEIESIPSENNPKSSSLAAWSVVALLKNLVAPITF